MRTWKSQNRETDRETTETMRTSARFLHAIRETGAFQDQDLCTETDQCSSLQSKQSTPGGSHIKISVQTFHSTPDENLRAVAKKTCTRTAAGSTEPLEVCCFALFTGTKPSSETSEKNRQSGLPKLQAPS